MAAPLPEPPGTVDGSGLDHLPSIAGERASPRWSGDNTGQCAPISPAQPSSPRPGGHAAAALRTLDTDGLPIRQNEDTVLAALRRSAVTIVVGETGSGKTTQLPQMLLDTPGLLPRGGRVVVTQPRRVAAIAVARRVSEERGSRVGGEVGYAVRFDECSSRSTRLKYATDGALLREMLSAPSLDGYDAVVLDEAHERSLNTDILFALLKRLLLQRGGRGGGGGGAEDVAIGADTAAGLRQPLKLVVMSATLDAAALAAFFGPERTAVVHVPGRQFPVELVHAAEDHEREYVEAAVSVAVDTHCAQPPGDILVFLAGQAEVEKAVRLISAQVAAQPASACGALVVLPLYAALPLELQARAFIAAEPGVRRCVVATNIAETSITLDGIVYVIDSGVCKLKTYDAASGLERLTVQPISRVQATQRAGRAGRTAPGTCFRLYTAKTFERSMADATPPEIQRVPLLGAVLALKALPTALGIDVLSFDFVDAPERAALEEALRQLHLLGAIDGGVRAWRSTRTCSHMVN